MFHNRNTENKINKMNERKLRLAYDKNLYLRFDELLIKSKSGGIYQRNLQFLASEMFKVKNGVSTGLAEDSFQFANKLYDLQNNRILLSKRNRIIFYGTKSLSSLAPRIWNEIPQSFKDEMIYRNSKLKSRHGLTTNAMYTV